MQQTATAEPTARDTTVRTTRPTFFAKAIEATWLLAAFLIPLAIMPEDAMIGFIQMPKVFVMRTAGFAMLVLVMLEWAFTADVGRRTALDLDGVARRAWLGLRTHPARAVYWAALAVLGANLISFALSPVRTVSFFGIDPGWDTYGIYSVAFYFAFFVVVSVRIRTREQLNRLFWALTATSILFSIYGIFQHFGIDPFKSDAVPVPRAGLTFGNPIFGASLLLMTIPLTIAVFLPYADRMSPVTHVLVGAALVLAQLVAFTFTQSRGPLVALAVAVAAYAVVVAVVLGARNLRRPAAILGVAVAIALVFNVIPVPGAQDGSRGFGDTVGSIAPDVAGGLNNRYVIWRTAAVVYFNLPWVDTEEFSELPTLSVRWLRPFVGFGPDMFGYVYPLAGDTEYTTELASHGHNFIVHTAIELGMLGVIAYLFLLASVSVLLFRLLIRAKRGELPDWFTYILLAFVWILVGRIVEQIPGKAQISDLQLMWVLCGVVVALYVMSSRLDERPLRAASSTGNSPQRRRNRSSRREATTRSISASMSLPRVVLAGSIALMVLFLWSTTVVNQVSAAFVARDANVAQTANRFDDARSLFNRSIGRAPDAPAPRMNLAQLLFSAGTQESQTVDQRIDWLEEADAQVRQIIKRNPLDQRAWSRVSEYERELAVLDPSKVDDALHANMLLVELMPGFWQARTGLAWAYVRLGQYQEALRVVQEAKVVRALEAADAPYILYYIQAQALEGLGEIDLAKASAHCSLYYQITPQVIELLKRNGETIGDRYDLTQADLDMCPEVANQA